MENSHHCSYRIYDAKLEENIYTTMNKSGGALKKNKFMQCSEL